MQVYVIAERKEGQRADRRERFKTGNSSMLCEIIRVFLFRGNLIVHLICIVFFFIFNDNHDRKNRIFIASSEINRRVKKNL